MKKLLLFGIVISSIFSNNIFANLQIPFVDPFVIKDNHVDIINQVSHIPFMDGPSLMPPEWIDSFFKIKIATYGENVYLYPKQAYKNLVGKNYGTAYLTCHYGNDWAWAVDDFDNYTWLQGKWGKFYDKQDEFVFAVTMNNIDLPKMKRDCKRSLESYGVTIANINQISFGVNHSYVVGTRLTQYVIVYYSEPDRDGLSYLIVNK